MQLGLPIDGGPITGHVGTTKFNIKLKWLRNRFQQMLLDLQDNALIQYAHCYILYLLGGVLLSDKVNNTVHVRYLPLLADYDAISTYIWGSTVLYWLYRAMCFATDYNVEDMAGCHTLIMSWIYYRLPF
ncbi:protein MAIN-LIKE 2-like [Arachis stenosperma]|uniref:protein MAIN-LIKE 2-like n=1 Tax=Arachis stenosperma TaxID=217475 RepID=UPI0025AD4D98|nr:protein MAIN-LIKE 2-like [Arachis stenosperma]